MGNEKIRIEHILSSDRTGDGDKLVTANTGDGLATSVPLLYDADGNVISTATRTGNTTNFATHDAGGFTSGNLVAYDGNGNLTDSGSSAPGGGGGAPNPPPTTGWSWVNQGSSTVTANSTFLSLGSPADSADSVKLYTRSTPSTPWTLDVTLQPRLMGVDFASAGLAVRESGSGKFYYLAVFWNQSVAGTFFFVSLIKRTSPTVAAAPTTNARCPGAGGTGGEVTFQVDDDGTNITFAILLGDYSQQILKESSTAFLTSTGADEFGPCICPRNASFGCGVKVTDWTVTGP